MVKLFKLIATFAAFMVLVAFAMNFSQTHKKPDIQKSIQVDESLSADSGKIIIRRYNLEIPIDKTSQQTWNEVTQIINELIQANNNSKENKTWVKIIKSKGLITVSATNQSHIKIKQYLDTLQQSITKQIKFDIKIAAVVGNKNKINNIIGTDISNQYDNIYMKGFSNSFYTQLSQNQSSENIINNLKSVGKVKVISFNFNTKNGQINKQHIKTIPGIKNATLSTLPYIGDLKSQVSLRLYFSKDIIDQNISLNHNNTYAIGGFAETSNIKNLKKLSEFSNLINYHDQTMFIIFVKPIKS